MKPNYVAHIKEEIDKLLKIGFIQSAKRATWLSPIVVVPKKNGKIQVCVDYRKLNAITIMDAFPLPFTDNVLDAIVGHEMYNFLDGFSDQEKMAFVTEWGVFVAVLMMFALKTTPTTFQRIISEVFGESIPTFMQVFLNDFTVYGARKDHMHHLCLCLERCRAARLSLNPTKCAFNVTSCALLGYIVSSEHITVDPDKMDAIIKASTPKNTKALGRLLGQLRWQSRMMRYLVDLAIPLHAAVHRTPFRWTEIEDKEALKIMLTPTQVVQQPDWTRPFHVFVDASDFAIGAHSCNRPSRTGMGWCTIPIESYPPRSGIIP